MHFDRFDITTDYPDMFPSLDLCPSPPPHSLNYPQTPLKGLVQGDYDLNDNFEKEFQHHVQVELKIHLEKEFAQELMWQHEEDSLHKNAALLPDDDLIFMLEL